GCRSETVESYVWLPGQRHLNFKGPTRRRSQLNRNFRQSLFQLPALPFTVHNIDSPSIRLPFDHMSQLRSNVLSTVFPPERLTNKSHERDSLLPLRSRREDLTKHREIVSLNIHFAGALQRKTGEETYPVRNNALQINSEPCQQPPLAFGDPG